MAGSATNKTEKKFNTLTKAKANNSNNSNNSLDRCIDTPDSREIPLNGFNRFDPKYVSIGPKALRESTFASTNLNKCATLRHGGRYGGSLSSSFDRGTNPVLKKATPPSVATVSKEFNATTTTTTFSAPPQTVSTATNTSTFVNTAYNSRSNTSLAGVGSGFASGYETDSGSTVPYRRSAMKQISNDSSSTFKREPTPIENRPPVETPQASVYSIDAAATYRSSAKTPQHSQKQAYHQAQQQQMEQQMQVRELQSKLHK